MTRAEITDRLTTMRLLCRGPLSATAREQVTALLHQERTSEARELNRTARQRCGKNLATLILAGPFDGALHTVTCPMCHEERHYRAPRASDG